MLICASPYQRCNKVPNQSSEQTLWPTEVRQSVQAVLIHSAGSLLCRHVCTCVHVWTSGTVGTISHNKIKASVNNDVIDFHRFSGRSVKSDLNEAEAPYCFGRPPSLHCNNVTEIATGLASAYWFEAFTYPSISYLQLPSVSWHSLPQHIFLILTFLYQ